MPYVLFLPLTSLVYPRLRLIGNDLQSDAEKKAYEIRDKASSTSQDAYNRASTLTHQASAEADKTKAEADKQAAKAKSSWWSWIGWGESKTDEAKGQAKSEAQEWKAAAKKEAAEVKKGPNA